MRDIDKIISNLDENALETLSQIALSMAKNKTSSFTGAVIWELNYSQGAIGSANEQVKRSMFNKRSRVRNKGVM